MLHYILIVLGAMSLLWACQQLRMALIYSGKIVSSALGVFLSPVLAVDAARSVLVSFACGIILILLPYPRLLTYLAIVWVFGEILGFIAKLILHIQPATRRFVAVELFGIAIRLSVFVAFALWIGF